MRLSSSWTLAVLVLGVVLAGAAVNAGYAADASEQRIENESITVGYDDPVAVDAPTDTVSFEPGATVRNASGAELTNGTDYVWSLNGTVDWINTTDTTAGNTGEITYNATAPSDTDVEVGQTMSILGQALGLAVLVAGAAAALRFGLGGDW